MRGGWHDEPVCIELLADGWRVPASLLGGVSVDFAELFGKPHLGAFYKRMDRHSQQVEDGASCVCCGRRASNAHHAVPLGRAGQFQLRSGYGSFVLLSPLFAVCGTGTTGCHDAFHGGAVWKPFWRWDSWEYADMWWSGWTLSHGIRPHDARLFEHGCYELVNLKTGSVLVYREPPRRLW